jgi:hypothetical protein
VHTDKPTSDKNKPSTESTPSEPAVKPTESGEKEKKSLKDKIKEKFSKN